MMSVSCSRKNLGILLSLGWAAMLLVPLIFLSAAHHVEIKAVAAPTTAPATGHWEMTHILVESCPCSKSIATHLISRRPQAGTNEQVWIAASGRQQAWVEDLAKAGFDVHRMKPQEILARANVNGGPWLIVQDPIGTRVYAGGYQDARPGTAGNDETPQDIQILTRLQAQNDVAPFRALGCGMGESFFQPLGIQCDSPVKESK